ATKAIPALWFLGGGVPDTKTAPRGAPRHPGCVRLLLLLVFLHFVFFHFILFHFVLLRFRLRGSRRCGHFDLLVLPRDVDTHGYKLAVLHLVERDRAVLGVAVLVE